LRVRDLLDVPGLGLRLLTDITGLDRAINHVYTTDLPDPGRYLTAGDLVLTGMMWCREPGDAERFVTVLARAGLDAMFRLIGREIGAECWLLTPMGRVVGGTGASLPRPVALGLACELLLATVPGSVLRSFRQRMLGPLVAYDQRHRAELLPTLREFLACSGSWNVCATTMYVHVNTVRYRIRRIEELTGRDLSSLDDQVDFFLALRIR
jgi:hypothetical protein